jgi:protein-S-isoprenylcysteine O-methyltransferase Ste14
MNQPQLLHVLGWIWAAFGVYWIAAARRGKAEQTRELYWYRLLRILLLAITFALLFSPWARVGPLGSRFLPRLPVVTYTGFALALAGMGVAVWARIHLGQYWSDKVVLKVDHQLISSGPYARMRHPIYSGVLLGVAGTALVIGEWRGVLAFFLLLTNYAVKGKREEKILAGAFAEGFSEHKRRAGFLWPRLYPKK